MGLIFFSLVVFFAEYLCKFSLLWLFVSRVSIIGIVYTGTCFGSCFKFYFYMYQYLCDNEFKTNYTNTGQNDLFSYFINVTET